MSDVAGYFVESRDGHSDLFICRACVEEHGLSTKLPLDTESFVFLPLKCGVHILGADPGGYAHA